MVGVRIKKAVKEVQKLTAQHAKATRAGEKHKAWHLRLKLLKSYNASLVAVWEANKRLPKPRRVPLTDLYKLAERLNVWVGTREEVLLQPRPKRSGGWRPIFSFGLLNRALHILVLRALEPTARPTEHQYASKGKGGRQAAVEAAADAMRNGYEWIIELDIKDCYPSFDSERVAQCLPLPREVAGRVISLVKYNLIPRKAEPLTLGPLDLLGQSQRGLPQGSALSPWIAEIVIAAVLRSVPFGNVRVITFADNILLMARTKSELRSMQKALRCAFQRCPVGRFQLASKKGVCHVSAGFDFLGYGLSALRGRVRISQSADNSQRLWRRLYRLKRDGAAGEDVARAIRSWAAAFPLVDWGAQKFANLVASLVGFKRQGAVVPVG
jgi:hypothetical protein